MFYEQFQDKDIDDTLAWLESLNLEADAIEAQIDTDSPAGDLETADAAVQPYSGISLDKLGDSVQRAVEQFQDCMP